MRAALRLALTPPIVQYDPDARDYITAVERADGQALETGVRAAIDAFVRGCKADGIWNAIKASCILAGARTLSGALVPLKGAAPTNFNFVSGDYNRKTGLVGNGSTKYLDSNRNNNADPQNSKHLSIFVSTLGNAPDQYYIAAGGYDDSGNSSAFYTYNTYQGRINIPGALPQSIASSGIKPSPSFVGMVRTASNLQAIKVQNTVVQNTGASVAPINASIRVFSGPDTQLLRANSRLAYYSIGEALDLALLDARVTTLVNSIASAIDGVTDPDARAYINAVENADGQALEVGVAQAYGAFITGCKADGIWNAIKASCILAGARTLSGALVPLKGAAPTNFNFVSGDYNRKTGLVGNEATKYLDSNRNNNADPQDNQHLSVYATTATTTGSYIGIGGSTGVAGSTHISRSASNMGARNRSSSFDLVTGLGASTGFISMQRSGATAYSYRVGGSVGTVTRSSQTPLSGNIHVFGSDGASLINARLAFYSIGEALDLALLDARVTTLVNTLNSVIP